MCLSAQIGAELAVGHMYLEPANGATVPAGGPVTFSGESNDVLTFRAASSEALLSSPDIDSGTGSQSGAFYKFTSTKATATPRTIYWTASSTFTPDECESPSTFTTPVRTLTVPPMPSPPTPAPVIPAATVTLPPPQGTGGIALAGGTITVQSDGTALVRLSCLGIRSCHGTLTLTAKGTASAKGSKRARAVRIGTARLSISGDEGRTVKLALDAAGRALLNADHGHMRASLTVLKSSPAPSETQIESVRLVQVKAIRARKR